MEQSLVQKTADYVKKKLENEHTGHDWFHIERVLKMARRLYKEEGGDLELIELAALLHDLGDYKQFKYNETKGSLVLRGMMDVIEIENDVQKKILKILEEAQFNGNETKVPSSIEGKIIQDADWLEALGAIGIARTFATGGHLKRMINDPERKPRRKLSKRDYQTKKREGTSINYFYEKAFKLSKMMNTKTARSMALKREEFMKRFINEFDEEWELKK